MEHLDEKNLINKAETFINTIWSQLSVKDNSTIFEFLPNREVKESLAKTALKMNLTEFDLAIMLVDISYKNMTSNIDRFKNDMKVLSSGSNIDGALKKAANFKAENKIEISEQLLTKVWSSASRQHGAKVVPRYGKIGELLSKNLGQYLTK